MTIFEYYKSCSFLDLDLAKIDFTKNLRGRKILEFVQLRFDVNLPILHVLGTSDDDVAEEAINENVETVENFKNKGKFFLKVKFSSEMLTTFEFSCQKPDTKLLEDGIFQSNHD